MTCSLGRRKDILAWQKFVNKNFKAESFKSIPLYGSSTKTETYQESLLFKRANPQGTLWGILKWRIRPLSNTRTPGTLACVHYGFGYLESFNKTFDQFYFQLSI